MISHILIKPFWIPSILLLFLNSCSRDNADLVVMTCQVDATDSTSNGWQVQKSKIIKSVNQYSPDVFGLQDIGKAECYALSLDLNSYHCVASDDNYSLTSLNPLYFRSNRFELVAKARYSIAHSSVVDSALKSIGYVSWVKLKELNSGYIFFVFNISFVEDYHLINKDLADFVGRINDIAGHAPAVIIGDCGNLDNQVLFRQQIVKNLADSQLVVDSSKTLDVNDFILSNRYFETLTSIMPSANGLGSMIVYLDFNFETFGK